ncbi:hypothetical protein BKA82DRAFT_1005961 [Pisolithus tinctorius]|uniref:Uncharacterized protein n=1 Tax=Pisolithus tinctorius Marx 270 TaxID=870435 RepID=A0A0C3JIW3_PISTI|nr:hypothetical protein BKA82DRAFT_1005961 [Pisolithus tinctorius]KIN97546.1 hypothetical protein M404DRAFT_1005961 [Pisolithus tinctorius Marx 270]
MLVPEVLLRILLRLPKLFIIANRRSSTSLHLLRYHLSFWNSIIQRQKRKHLPGNDTDSSPASTERVDSRKEGLGFRCPQY